VNVGLIKGLEDLKVSLRKGEAPEAKPEGGEGAASSAPAAPSKPKPKAAAKAAPPPPSNLPIGQQWIEAAKKGDRAAMESLHERHSGEEDLVHHKARGIGHTAMHWAAAQGDRGMMEWLVSLGGDVNARNTSDATPLHTAAGAAQFMSVEWLLEHGVDTSLRNDDDLTPAALANKRGRKDIAEAIDRGARAPPPPAAPPEEPLNNLPAGMQQVLDNEEVD
jgi:hypothetical protein